MMNKIVGVIIVLLLAGYFVNTYVENNAKREAERIKTERDEQNIKASVQELVSRLNAVTSWDSQLSNGESYRIEPILTVELERLWITERPILFVGRIQDIKTKDKDNYTVVVERNMLSSYGNMFSTDLQLSLVASKNQIDAFLKIHPDLFKGLGFYKDIAVVASIASVETVYISGEECAREEIKIGYGKMLDLDFVGRVKL